MGIHLRHPIGTYMDSLSVLSLEPEAERLDTERERQTGRPQAPPSAETEKQLARRRRPDRDGGLMGWSEGHAETFGQAEIRGLGSLQGEVKTP